MGKTRLALQVAHDALEEKHFGDGVYFVALDGLNHAEEVLPHVLATLHVTVQVNQDPLEILVQFLATKHLLLVLDNFESVLNNVQNSVQDVANLLNTLLGRCAKLSILLTSRVLLNLKAEWHIKLEGLDFLPILPLEHTSLENLNSSDAVQLFLERARQARLDFELTPQNAVLVQRLCALCGGFPLALELTAAWLRSHSLLEVLNSLETQGIALETPNQDVRPRHRSMSQALEHSWNLLGSLEQKGLAQLSVFAGGFTLEAALAVCNLDQTILDHLAAQSLLNGNCSAR
jgi:predicted ATPase